MLDDKVCIITGGSRGIGRAIAIEFSAQGAQVAVIYNGNPEKANQTVEECMKISGKKAKAYKCNVGNFNECSDVVKEIIKDFGTIDVLVNNAGITKDKLLLTMSDDDFNEVISVNLGGVFNMTKNCCRTFTKQRSGKIINISSIAALDGNAGQTNYSASKAGIIGFTKSTAKELASRNICCNAIAPGFIETDMTKELSANSELIDKIPLKRIGKAEEVASLAAYLCNNDYITGEVIRIDGGLTI